MPHEPLPLQPRADRYTVDPEPLAVGGMGAVWSAYDTRLGRRIAVKSLKTSLHDNEAVRERMLRETRILAMLSHPGICHLYDQYLDEEPASYTMQLVHGRTMNGFIDELHAVSDDAERRDTLLRRLVSSVARIADTLAYAHEQGVVHRDLKPENIMLGRFGEVFVMDWGIATPIDTGAADGGGATTDLHPGLSMAGQVIGTPAYLSPEQLRGETVDQRTDVFGIGAILCQVLSGRAPLKGVSLAEALASREAIRVEAPEWIPKDLVAVAEKALAREREDRYQSASAMADDLERYLARLTVTARRYTALERFALWRRRNRGPLRAASLVAVIAAVAILGVLANHLITLQETRREVETALAASERSRGELLLRGGDPIAAAEALESARLREASLGVSSLPTELYLEQAYRATALPIVELAPREGLGERREGVSAISPDCGVVYSALEGGGVVGHEVLTGRECFRASTPGAVRQMEVSHDGATVAVAVPEAGVAVGLSTADGSVEWTLADERTERGTRGIALARDARTVAVAIQSKDVLVWPEGAGSDSVVRVSVERAVNGMALSFDGRTLVVGDENRDFSAFDTSTDEELWTIEGRNQGVFRFALTPCGEEVVVAGTARDILRVRLRDGEILARRIDSPYEYVRACTLEDGRLIALSTQKSDVVELIDPQSLDVVHTLRGAPGDLGGVRGSSSGRLLAVDRDGRWCLWGSGSRPGAPNLLVAERVESASLALDEAVVVATIEDVGLRVFDRATRQVLITLPLEEVGESTVDVAPDGERFMVTRPSLRAVDEWRLADLSQPRVIHRGSGERSWIYGTLPARYDPSGRRAVIAGDDGRIVVAELDGRSDDRVIDRSADGDDGSRTWSLRFGPQGRTVLAAVHDRPELRIWDARTGELLGRSPEDGQTSPAYQVDFTRDGSTYYVGEWNATVRRHESGSLAAEEFTIHSGPVMDLVLTSDEAWLFTASWDTSCRLVDVETMKPVWTFGGYGDVMYDVAQASDGVLHVLDGGGRVFAFDPAYPQRYARMRGRSRDALAQLQAGHGAAAAFLLLSEVCAFREEWGLAADYLDLAVAGGASPGPLHAGRVTWAAGRSEEARSWMGLAVRRDLLGPVHGALVLGALNPED